MTTTKQIRWRCPECERGVNAPTRLRKLDVRRWCLDCSRSTGQLVERSAPVLDRKREATAAKRAEAAKANRARVSQAKAERKQTEYERWTLPGFDYRREAEALWRIVQRHEIGKNWRQPCPEVTLTARGTHGRSHAYRSGFGRWSVRISPNSNRASAWETLAHELAHCAVGKAGSEGWHGPTFYKAIAEITRRRLGLDVSFAELRTIGGYKTDRVIKPQIAEFVEWCEAVA